MNIATRILPVVTFALLPSRVFAVQLKEVSDVLLTGGGVITKLIWAVCIIVGIMLIAAAFTQFQIHRRNPKLVPLTTPVMYLILGVAAIAIPFMNRMTEFLADKPGKAATHQSQQSAPKQHYNPNDIDAPLN